MTLEEYYRRRYSIVLKYTKWPLFYKKTTTGKANYFPIELCNVADRQRVPNKALRGREQADIVRVNCKSTEMVTKLFSLQATAIPPGKRLDAIKESAQIIAKEHNNDPDLMKAGIEVDAKPLKVDGRILPAPRIWDGVSYNEMAQSNN